MSATSNIRQHWDAQGYGRDHDFIHRMGEVLIELLEPQPGQRILDLGCGDGALTEKLAATGADVVGVDAAPEFIAAARARGLDALLMDAQRLEFDAEFDGAISNAALHWMTRPDDVLTGMARALKPGARFVGEFGGHRNVPTVRLAIYEVARAHGIDPAPLSPWYFPTADEYCSKLEAAGFIVEMINHFPRHQHLPNGMGPWLRTFGQSFFHDLDEATREAAFAQVEDKLRPFLCDASGNWTADYMRVRFAARRAPGPASR